MKVIDFSVGAGGPTRVFAEAGDEVITFQINARFDHPDTQTFMQLTAQDLLEKYGRPDFVWASPPCVTFSVASIGHHWTGGRRKYMPKTQAAVDNLLVVEHLRSLIEGLDPVRGFIIENPRGILRKLDVLDGLELRTVTYCSYGDTRMKPTDLWGSIPGWWPQDRCKPGDQCHESAPRGSRTGTQALKTASDRAHIPRALGEEIRAALEAVSTTLPSGFLQTK